MSPIVEIWKEHSGKRKLSLIFSTMRKKANLKLQYKKPTYKLKNYKGKKEYKKIVKMD